MIRNVITIALGSAAVALAAPAIAAPGGGGHGGGPSATGIGARAGSQGPMNASPTGVLHSSPNSVLHDTTTTPTATTRAVNSQGLQHASPTGISHANSNSVLARGSVAASTLPGLTTGLTVNNSTGTSLGTVSQVITGTDGSIRMVVVTTSTGQTLRLPASSLTISGGVVTTTYGG